MSSSLLLLNSAPVSSTVPTTISPRRGRGRGSASSASPSCLYTAQGELVCGGSVGNGGWTENKDDLFGNPIVVRRLRSSIGFADPYDVNTSRRYNEYVPHDNLRVPMLKEYCAAPCCRDECSKTAPCDDPMAFVKSPHSTCAQCQVGKCNRHC